MAYDGEGDATPDIHQAADEHVERLVSALEQVQAELDELRVANFQLHRENLRLRISLELLHESGASEDALDELIALRKSEPQPIKLEP